MWHHGCTSSGSLTLGRLDSNGYLARPLSQPPLPAGDSDVTTRSFEGNLDVHQHNLFFPAMDDRAGAMIVGNS